MDLCSQALAAIYIDKWVICNSLTWLTISEYPLTKVFLLPFLHSDYLFKLLLIGDSGVGKSCLLLRFAVSVPHIQCLFITSISPEAGFSITLI